MNQKIVTTKELAAALGVSGARIRAMVQQGILDLAVTERPQTKTGPYRFNLAIAQDCVSKYLSVRNDSQIKAGRTGTGKRAGRSDRDRLLQAQIKKAVASAKLKELDFLERQKTLVSAESVTRNIFSMGRQVRDAMLNIPDRVSAILAPEPNEHKVRLILTTEIRQALELLSENII